MTENDAFEFEAELQSLASLFNKNLEEQQITQYFNTLKKYSLREVVRALESCREQEKYFPVPATIIEHIQKFRTANPPQTNESCERCSGTGFTTVYLKLNLEKLKESGWKEDKLPVASWAIQQGIMETVTEKEFMEHNGRIYSFAEKCQCRA